MTKKKTSESRGESASPRDYYSVGYGKPPRQHQFKPGHSGNPRGRPKGAKGEDTIFSEIANTRVPVSLRGAKACKVPLIQAVWMKIADDALKGNAKAQSLFTQRCRALAAPVTDDHTMQEDDEKVFNSYLRQLKAELEGKE